MSCGYIAIEEMRIDVIPERVPTRDHCLVKLVCELPPAFIGRFERRRRADYRRQLAHLDGSWAGRQAGDLLDHVL
jgi:hypothetical protein